MNLANTILDYANYGHAMLVTSANNLFFQQICICVASLQQDIYSRVLTLQPGNGENSAKFINKHVYPLYQCLDDCWSEQ